MHGPRLPVVLFALLTVPALMSAQNIVSARAGLVHLADGRVLLDERPIVHKVAHFQEMKENSVLRTERGRAEVLLSPGSFVRLGEQSRMVLLSSRLTDVRVRLEAGSAVVEIDELDRAGSIAALAGDFEVRMERAGLYRLDAPDDGPPRLRVFSGEAAVGRVRVKAHREVVLAGDLPTRKFDPDDTDALDRWSRRRANYLAMAGVSASRLAWERDARLSRSSWYWNPYFGLYTFLPMRGVVYNPYGFGIFSPGTVYAVYHPPRPSPPPMDLRPSFNANYGYATAPHTPAGTSGVIATAPSSPVSQGGEAHIPRGTETGGGAARR